MNIGERIKTLRKEKKISARKLASLVGVSHTEINNIESGVVYDESKVEETHNRMEKINKFSDNLYLYGFLTFWFGFLIVFDYFAIKDWANGGSTMFFISLTFWAAGIFMLFKKRKNS